MRKILAYFFLLGLSLHCYGMHKHAAAWIHNNRAKAGVAAYGLYSAAWYLGVGALTAQSYQVNKENEKLKQDLSSVRKTVKQCEKTMLLYSVLSTQRQILEARVESRVAKMEKRIRSLEKSKE